MFGDGVMGGWGTLGAREDVVPSGIWALGYLGVGPRGMRFSEVGLGCDTEWGAWQWGAPGDGVPGAGGRPSGAVTRGPGSLELGCSRGGMCQGARAD